MNLTKKDLLAALPAGPMRNAHRGQTPVFIWKSLKTWSSADEKSRLDILAFFRDDGPKKVESSRRRLGSK